MPIPRRFDRRPPERDQTRVNERIRVPEVRLIGEDGNQVGVISRDDALAYAQQRDLDLVEVAAEARPPVVRVLDYSKYKYEQEQKAKAAKRHQKNINVREIKLRPKIAENDYSTKKGHVSRFLKAQDKVKVTIMFRGREMTHPERGERLLLRLADEIQELGTVEQRPTQDGRNMIMMLAPLKTRVDAEAEAGDDGEPAAPAATVAEAPVAATPAVPAGGEGTEAETPAVPEGLDAATPAVPEGSGAATPAVPDVAEVPTAAATRSPARRRASPGSATRAPAGKEADSPPAAEQGAGDAPPAPIAASGKPARKAPAPKGSAAKAPAARKGNGAAEDPAADAVESDPATAAS